MEVEDKAARSERAHSFGDIAHVYERFRPGPAPEVAAWLLPDPVERVVDLGAGTGALTRYLLGRADEVVAVEPDPRMRALLATKVGGAIALAGDSEHIPLADGVVDAVVVSSAWHWMEPAATVREVARVLRPGGLLGVVWAGPNWEAGVLADARRLLRPSREPNERDGQHPADRAHDPHRPRHVLALPPEAPFDPPEHEVLQWERRLSADQLVGMLGTFSNVIVLPQAERAELLEHPTDLVRAEVGGVPGTTVSVPFRASCWKTRRHS